MRLMANTGMHPRHWITVTGVSSFIAQLVIATVGAMLVGMLAAVITALPIAFLRHAPNGSVVDRVLDQPLFKLGADNPYFAGPVLTGFIFGWTSHRFFVSRTAAWVWIVPALVLAWNLVTWKSYSPLPHWADVRANFFTSNCGDSDCLYELVVTGPFYTSVAYTVGWIARNLAQWWKAVAHRRRVAAR